MINFWITRSPGRDEEYIEKNLKPSFKSGRVIVRVWDYFCEDELRALYILSLSENINAKWYKQVLQRYLIPFYKRIRRKYNKEVVFIEDRTK